MSNNTILNKFTNHYKQVVSRAYWYARQAKSATIGPQHLLWGLAAEPGSLSGEILRKAGLQSPVDLNYPSAQSASVTPPLFSLPFDGEAKSMIKKSVFIASDHKHKYIGTEHLLLGIIASRDTRIMRILETQGVDLALLQKHTALVLKSTSRFPDLTQALAQAETAADTEKPGEQQRKTKTPALDFFATELTQASVQSGIDPVIGREREINRIIQILLRKTKNNPILLGDPGVGKTAIVEGLAKRIFEGTVPDLLLRKRIYHLDLALIVAGTVYRGEFESRLKQILEEVRDHPDIILFIDEIHTIVGAGSASGSLDAANILKPALARGEIRCIGATTFEEYKRHFEGDPALERRFQAVLIPEPSVTETIAILKGIKGSYESHHHVDVDDDAITSAATLAAQYLPEKRLPDKAIDLIDEASARIRLHADTHPQLRAIRELEVKYEALKQQKELAVREENFPLALQTKEEERTILATLQKLREQEQERSRIASKNGTVTREEVAHVLSEMTGIPLGNIAEPEAQRLLHLEDELKEKIVGQDEVLKSIASFIRRSRAGLAGSTRPVGSFIFLGPSGVGKTETAKELAHVLFRDPDSFIRFDMSEFSESFHMTKLIGAPAGYVGYREGGRLTELVRRRPYAVILLDEIEKAHPEIFNLFLSILDEGHCMDATGRRIDFHNTVIIMTSNVGLAAFNAHASLGFALVEKDREMDAYESIKEKAMSELKERFRPEFLNRIDRIAVFHPLHREHIHAIVAIHLERLRAELAKQAIDLRWNDAALRRLARASISPQEGARRVARTVREQVEDAIAGEILRGKYKKGAAITLTVRKDAIAITAKSTQPGLVPV